MKIIDNISTFLLYYHQCKNFFKKSFFRSTAALNEKGQMITTNIIKKNIELFLISCIYLCLFVALYSILKSPAVTIVSILFVSYISLKEGIIAGIMLSFFNFLWNAVVFNFISPGQPIPLEGYISIFVHIVVSILLGHLGRLSRDLETEVELRKQTEALLKNSQNNLEQQVAARTQELEKAYKRLHQAEKMEAIGTLAGGIAHDFNNILCAILGYAELAHEDSLKGTVIPSDIQQVIHAGNRAKELVKQILSFSRQAESHKITLQPTSIVKESIKLLRSAIPKTIEINQEIDGEIGLISADPTQIHQIIMNLCTNAYQAMEETGGTITLSLKNKVLTPQDLEGLPHVEPGNFVQLSVKDTGSGIPLEIREKIFDPYFTTKEVGKGTGMGLAIVHGIVKSYGGFITCRSNIGAGTTFEILFPCPMGQIPPEQAMEISAQGGHEQILFIDDEEMLTQMAKTMLERIGYNVTTRTSSLEALSTFHNTPDSFDIVITDQTMPGMTGLDLSRRMLQIRPDIPIILSTGYSNQVSEEKAKAAGIKGFAMKPLTQKEISALIRSLLD